MAKNPNNEVIEDVPAVDDTLLDSAAELVELPTVLAAPSSGPAAGKRALGVKEPINFKWKLVGTSHNMTLTLFKAVERDDVEAQYARTQKEGYYTDLKIIEADARVEQPALPKVATKVTPRNERVGRAVTPSPSRTSIARRRSATPTSPPRKPASTKRALKPVAKSTKRKSRRSKSGPKRATKKK